MGGVDDWFLVLAITIPNVSALGENVNIVGNVAIL